VRGTLRRVLVASVVLVGAVAPAVPAAAADCTGPRLVGVQDTRVVEGTSVRGGYTAMTFTVTSTGCAQPGSVRYAAAGYSAREKADFLPTSGTLTYPAGGQGSLTVTVPVVADAVAEPIECLSLQLSVATGTIRADPAQARGFIVDDDGRLVVQPRGFICSE
jgi:hypothetical protein